MKLTINVRGIHEHEAKVSDNAIRNYIEQKDLERIKKLFGSLKEPIFINITVDIKKPHPHHACDLRIHSGGYELIVKKEGPELYKVIDLVFDDAFEQLAKHKEKQIDKLKHSQKINLETEETEE